MTEKLKNKNILKAQDAGRPLTLEQQIEKLEKEKLLWKDCRNAMIDKIGEFFPLRDVEEVVNGVPKKDFRDEIYQHLYDACDKVNEDLKKRKTNILNQMTPTQRWEWEWNELQKEKQAWKKERAETLKKIEEHYKTHKGGGMFYRWFDDDCYHMEQYFAEKEQKLRERCRQLDKLKLLNDEFERLRQEEEFAKVKTKKPHLVKASLKPVEKQKIKTQRPLKTAQKSQQDLEK